jgi:hypothetical protein
LLGVRTCELGIGWAEAGEAAAAAGNHDLGTGSGAVHPVAELLPKVVCPNFVLSRGFLRVELVGLEPTTS